MTRSNKTKKELEAELIIVNKNLAEIVLSSRAPKQSFKEKILWLRKCIILAELNPINL